MKIPEVQFIKSISATKDKPEPKLPEIAMIGRSNVGKSSMINSVFNRRHLAKTSSTPGKTRLINYFLVDNIFYLVDLPGYGFTKLPKYVTKNWERTITGYLINNKWLKWVFLLIDCRHDLMNLDRQMINWLTGNAIPFILILTKSDKLSNNRLRQRIRQMEDELAVIEIMPYSAKNHRGRDEILEIFKQIE